MSRNSTPYDHPNQVAGREPHVHSTLCNGWDGERDCGKVEGLPNNQNWDKENIASPSPIDRATHVARRVKTTASELLGSLREHFDGGQPEAPKPFVRPTLADAPKKQAPEALPMYTEETPYKDRITKEGSSLEYATQESMMGGDLRPMRSIVENAARRLKNHVVGAVTGGTHLMTWTRGDTWESQQTRNRVQGANGESVGGDNITMAKPGDVRRRDPHYETHDKASADHYNTKAKGAKLEDFLHTLKYKVLPTAGAERYHVQHKVTLTRESERVHGTSTMTLDGAEMGETQGYDLSSKPTPALKGQHREGTPDSRGVAPHVSIDPSHIAKIEVHTKAA